MNNSVTDYYACTHTVLLFPHFNSSHASSYGKLAIHLDLYENKEDFSHGLNKIQRVWPFIILKVTVFLKYL
jgi:hypothetical protein